MSKSIPEWVPPVGKVFPIGRKKETILGHDDMHFSDFPDTEIDEQNGDRLAYEIGTTWLQGSREFDLTSIEEWTRISKALRLHGYTIVPEHILTCLCGAQMEWSEIHMGVLKGDNMTKFLDLITNSDLRDKLKLLHAHYKVLIEMVPASVKYHHNWTGGYQDHVRQVIEKAVMLYSSTGDIKLNFTLDDVILVAYIHDLDKLFRYQRMKQPKDGREWEFAGDYPSYDDSAKVAMMCAEFGILLTDVHLEALAMHHGGWSANSSRTMTPLAVILHSADLMSTYITNHKGD